MNKICIALTIIFSVALSCYSQDEPDKTAPQPSVAPVTSYTPQVNEKLTYSVVLVTPPEGGKPPEVIPALQEVILKKINQDRSVNIELQLRNQDLTPIEGVTQEVWKPASDDVMNKLQALGTEKEFVVSNKRFKCLVVQINGQEIWITIEKGKHTYPGVVKINLVGDGKPETVLELTKIE